MSAFLPAPLTIVVFLLVDHHLLGATEHGQRDVLELDAEVFRDGLTAGQDRDCPVAWPCDDRRSPAP